MATVSVTGLAALDLNRLSLSSLSNPANYAITEASESVLAFRVGTEFSYRLTGSKLFSLGQAGSTINSLKVTFGSTTFEVSGLNIDFFSLFQKILVGDASAGFDAFLTGDDTVLGTDIGEQIRDLVGHNNLFGYGGADTLTGGTGNDHIYGQSANGGTDGNDVISAGGGSDYVNGNAGDDSVGGGDGSDRIQGGQGNDSVSGDAGNDTLNGNRGNDQVMGGEGNDSIRGGQDNDTLSGGNGNDVLSGDLGVDQLTGGCFVDRFIFGACGSPVGTSIDTVTDFQQGSDMISLGFTPAAVLVGTSTFSTIDAARTGAQSLFDGAVGSGEVAAVALSGGTTLLFWSSTGGATIDSVAAFQSQIAGDFGLTDFV